MSGLPFGIAEPLHIEEPFPAWKVVLAALVLWLLYRLARALYRRLQRAAQAPRPAAPPPPPLLGGIGAVIDDIRRRYQTDYRRGCHALAEALRRHFDRAKLPGSAGRAPYPTLTAREIERHIGDTALTRFFALLSELQFHRREPTQSDFEGACELAAVVAESAVASTHSSAGSRA